MRAMRYVLFFGLLVQMNAFAYTGFGICNYGKESVASVVCYGPTVLKETQVAGDVKVTGTLRAYQIKAASVTVTGAADMESSAISGPVNVVGVLNATKVDFAGDVNVTAQNVSLNQCTIKGSMIISSEKKEPHLKLACGTGIAGSVTFSGAPGVVEVSEDSIVQGKVVNGEMAFVKETCH